MTERETFHPHAMLDAALADDSGQCHDLARRAGTSMRHTLYWAAVRMQNALAGEEMRRARLLKIWPALTPTEQWILKAAGEGAPPTKANAVDAAGLRARGLLDAQGNITEDGSEVLNIEATRRAVSETALSDEDMDHEDGPRVNIERVRGVWPS